MLMKQKIVDRKPMSNLGNPSKVAELQVFFKLDAQQPMQGRLTRVISAQIKVACRNFLIQGFSRTAPVNSQILTSATTAQPASTGQGV